MLKSCPGWFCTLLHVSYFVSIHKQEERMSASLADLLGNRFSKGVPETPVCIKDHVPPRQWGQSELWASTQMTCYIKHIKTNTRACSGKLQALLGPVDRAKHFKAGVERLVNNPRRAGCPRQSVIRNPVPQQLKRINFTAKLLKQIQLWYKIKGKETNERLRSLCAVTPWGN